MPGQVARRTGLQVRVDEAKMRAVACLGLAPAEAARFTTDPRATPLHVCRMGFAGEARPAAAAAAAAV